jgi:1-phosphofructokinase family hexose kinase
MILVLCANAGVDRTYEVDNFGLGRFHHPRRQRVVPGGKGINVARALRVFGARVVLTGFAGGLAAKFIEQEMAKLGVQPAFVSIAEESRVCINIVDTQSRSQTQVDEVGPLVSPSEVDKLRRRWARLVEKAQLAVIAGNAPRGVPLDLYAELVEICHSRHVPVLLDAHDELLQRALEARPTLVKPNLSELERLLGRQLSVPQGVLEVLNGWVAGGTVQTGVVSVGGQGALAVNAAGERYWAKPPQIKYLGSVGSGDAMLAGIAAAMAAGKGLPEQLRWGTAAGAANAATFGACLFDLATVQQCLRGVQLLPLTENGKLVTETTHKGPESEAGKEEHA